MIIIMLLIILIAILGAPLFTIIGLTAIVNFVKSGYGIIVVPQEIAGIASMPLLHSIPLFTFAGYLLAHSKASTRLVRVTKAALGWMPGGLAIVTILACSIFTAFTGASGVTIVALGGFLLPALLSEKYGERYSLGLVTSSGSFGLLFPPSLPIIIFGVVAAASIDKLFIAGIVPGVFLIIVLSLHAMLMSKRFKVEKTKFLWKELGRAFWDAKWEIPFPILLFAGIYSGKLEISDAASFAVVYILVVELLLTKDIKIKDLPKIMKESMLLVGAILIILSVSLAATNYIIDAQIPQKIFEMIQGFITNKWVFLILLNIFLLIVGCIMDIFSALIVVVPLILPIAAAYNINLIHLGIIFLANLQIGYITPPIGMNLFIASIRFNKPVLTLYKSALIFIGLLLASLIVITYVPKLSIWFLEEPSIVGQWEYQDKTGNIDKISIKACGRYVRRQGNFMDIMMGESYYGEYKINKNILTFYTDDGEEEYKYEIFNGGKRLLMEKLSIESDEYEDDEYSNEEYEEEFEWIDEEEESGRIFYKNILSPPIGVNTGKFISKWGNNEDSIEFHFNGLSTWIINGQKSEYRYKINNRRKITFIDFSYENNEYAHERIFYYKFSDPYHLTLKNKDDTYTYTFIDSSSDN